MGDIENMSKFVKFVNAVAMTGIIGIFGLWLWMENVVIIKGVMDFILHAHLSIWIFAAFYVWIPEDKEGEK